MAVANNPERQTDVFCWQINLRNRLGFADFTPSSRQGIVTRFQIGATSRESRSIAVRFGALTDGLMIIRRLFRFSGDLLIANAVGPDAIRTEAADIEAYIDSISQ